MAAVRSYLSSSVPQVTFLPASRNVVMHTDYVLCTAVIEMSQQESDHLADSLAWTAHGDEKIHCVQRGARSLNGNLMRWVQICLFCFLIALKSNTKRSGAHFREISKSESLIYPLSTHW